MPTSLREYARKRRFEATPEPAGRRAPRRGARPIFVVQLHHARARHYDFRLEVGGVLKSWAVPKGPSLRPQDKRLAVQVEDHPLAYAGFEGDIPKGQYGAGRVVIFDRGTWSADGDPAQALAEGKLDLTLRGERLRGDWTLLRTRMAGGRPHWLLIKRDDGYARDAEADDLLDAAPARGASTRGRSSLARAAAARSTGASAARRPRSPRAQAGDAIWRKAALALDGARDRPLPAGFKPQLASLRTAAPDGEGWLHEVKWDGYRMLADLDDGRVRLRSRNDLDWTPDFPAIARALETLPVSAARFDGELVALDGDGRSDFTALQRTLEGSAEAPLRYLLFDLPAIAGVDLTGVALIERKRLLEALLAHDESEALAFSAHLLGHGPQVFEGSRRQGLEGIVSKRVDAPYVQHRSDTWLKVKHHLSDEFVVVGYTAPKRSRIGFGSLLMAEPAGDGLRYAGRVGTGFDNAALQALTGRLERLQRDNAVVELPAHVPFSARGVRWVEPVLVAEVAFRGRGKEGLLRQASFLRLREDKSAEDLGDGKRTQG